VPTVLLVLEGGQGTLKTVRETISKNIPVVVIAGSGRAADLIDYASNNKQLYVQETLSDLV
jgi:prophage tail gpP-like protein